MAGKGSNVRRLKQRQMRGRGPRPNRSTVDCVVVGGPARGMIVKVNAEAQFIKLQRPTHIKPIERSGQLAPEVAFGDEGVYEFHVVGLQNTGEDRRRLIGVAVYQGPPEETLAKIREQMNLPETARVDVPDGLLSLSDAIKELIVAYAEKITGEYIAAGRLEVPNHGNTKKDLHRR